MTMKIALVEQGWKKADQLLHFYKGVEREGEKRVCVYVQECHRGLRVSSIVFSPE